MVGQCCSRSPSSGASSIGAHATSGSGVQTSGCSPVSSSAPALPGGGTSGIGRGRAGACPGCAAASFSVTSTSIMVPAVRDLLRKSSVAATAMPWLSPGSAGSSTDMVLRLVSRGSSESLGKEGDERVSSPRQRKVRLRGDSGASSGTAGGRGESAGEAVPGRTPGRGTWSLTARSRRGLASRSRATRSVDPSGENCSWISDRRMPLCVLTSLIS
mmetsp:Transcript_107720/g.314943  ORF Transcript_107720/g.314943 Transcript_107720/m.314943 type:complete len:215 (+) Transcript_107720:179-823(+)